MHHADRITNGKKLGKVGTDEDDRFPGGCEITHDSIDFSFADDINAASRFIEDQDRCIVAQKPAERDLLLISAG